jgi:hypothetical protein
VDTFIETADELGSDLNDLAWDLHVAVQRGDTEGATATAGEAMRLFSDFHQQTADLEPDQACLQEGWSMVTGAIEAERQRWLAWSEGRDHPTVDDAEVFFAFHGMPYPWGAMLPMTSRLICPGAVSGARSSSLAGRHARGWVALAGVWPMIVLGEPS